MSPRTGCTLPKHDPTYRQT
ncbi:hypothetical protein DM992_24355 [Burkholderia sp. JP2-270]|nr:hypothetical protein DM992_24355 [Burkholderia sp. JP2-270]